MQDAATPEPSAPSTSGDVATTQAHVMVARAAERLAEAEGRPVSEHVAVLDDVHRSLQDALATLDGA